MKSVALRSVAVSSKALRQLDLARSVRRLEEVAGKKRRKRKRKGDPYPIEKTSSGGGKKSKRKGASFEQSVAKLFAAYLGCSVRRTPGSGGWATVGDFGPRGDLVFASRKAPYHVECKKHEGWDLSDLITGVRAGDKTVTNSIEKWWQQTVRDCPKRKHPMLIFARNLAKASKGRNVGVPPLLMMRQDDFRALGTVWKKRTKQTPLSNGLHKAPPILLGAQPVALWCAADFIPHLTFSNDDGVRVVCLLSDFFRFTKPPKGSPRRKLWQRGVG